jgi:thymidylate kinase
MFIVLEGCDAVGKNTQSERLAKALQWKHDGEEKVPPWVVSFPRYDTDLGRAMLRHLRKEIMLTHERGRDSSDIRIDGDPVFERAPEDALAFQCFMLADKVDASPKILNQLGYGGDVIADRWWPSAYAYGGSDGLPDEWLLNVHKILPVVILLDLPVEIALSRAEKRAAETGKKVDRYETIEKQTRIRKRYHELLLMAEREHDERWRLVDAQGSKEDVAARVLDAVETAAFKKATERGGTVLSGVILSDQELGRMIAPPALTDREEELLHGPSKSKD